MSLKYLLAVLALAAAPAAFTADAYRSGQRLAASCANCHGTDGRPAGSAIPGLAGKPTQFIVARMREFKAGTRTATVMQQLANGYSDQQIELIAAFFSRQAGPEK